ncbi:hypothetical protein [Burkholderia diffusa]|uniref:hypothetical protein n=1 Tax=Burkholderia diffusa TaxID=488732 RepID=UPI00158E5906|nr:hypothetical protein [Burkholderia diffusa]
MTKSIDQLKKDVEHAETALYNAKTALSDARDREARDTAHMNSIAEDMKRNNVSPAYEPSDC